jgi:tetratricopeptide (TPR) repeat protein
MIRWIAVLSAVCLAYPLATLADTVTMVDGMVLEGKINKETPEYVILLVYNESGRVRIPRYRIKAIDYDFPTKAAALKPDDYKGHYDLGAWAFHRGMYAEAIQELEKAKGQPGAGEDLYKLLGLAYDRTGDFQKALQSYKEYLRTHPDDKEVAQRVDELGKSLNPTATAEGPKPKTTVAEGLENSFKWVAEPWKEANPCAVSISVDPANGNRTISVQIQAGNKDKSAFGGNGANGLNLSDCKEMVCKIYHDSPAEIRLATAFINAQGEYVESREQKVAGNNWVTYAVPLTGNAFKSAKTEWNYKAALEGKENVTRVVFLVYGQRALNLYVDSIFFR